MLNDFVGYTHKSPFIERFTLNEQFWKDAIRKVGKNFPTFFLSQLVMKGMKLSAGPPLE